MLDFTFYKMPTCAAHNLNSSECDGMLNLPADVTVVGQEIVQFLKTLWGFNITESHFLLI